MNEKFFDLKKEKQDRFINAALKTFAENGYKKASTDEIVGEAGISKGLLFHYFGSKQGLYEFVYNYSTKYITMEYTRSIPQGQVDFFDLQTAMIAAQREAMRTYPYMNIFLTQAFREKDSEIVEAVAVSMDQYSAFLGQTYGKADVSRFQPGIYPSGVLKMCLYIADGILLEQFRDQKTDADKYYEDNISYLHLLRKQFYLDC